MQSLHSAEIKQVVHFLKSFYNLMVNQILDKLYFKNIKPQNFIQCFKKWIIKIIFEMR